MVLDENGHCLLTDFGIAKLVCEEDPAKTMCGSHKRIAPEVLAGGGKEYGFAADFYSLGCLVYELVNGSPPFNNLRAEDRKMMVKRGAIPAFKNKKVDPQCKNFIS